MTKHNESFVESFLSYYQRLDVLLAHCGLLMRKLAVLKLHTAQQCPFFFWSCTSSAATRWSVLFTRP